MQDGRARHRAGRVHLRSDHLRRVLAKPGAVLRHCAASRRRRPSNHRPARRRLRLGRPWQCATRRAARFLGPDHRRLRVNWPGAAHCDGARAEGRQRPVTTMRRRRERGRRWWVSVEEPKDMTRGSNVSVYPFWRVGWVAVQEVRGRVCHSGQSPPDRPTARRRLAQGLGIKRRVADPECQFWQGAAHSGDETQTPGRKPNPAPLLYRVRRWVSTQNGNF